MRTRNATTHSPTRRAIAVGALLAVALHAAQAQSLQQMVEQASGYDAQWQSARPC